MQSLWNTADEAEIRSRIEKLTAASPRKWGKMTVDKMLKHLDVAYASAAGKIELPDEGFKTAVASIKPIARLIIYKMPWPKSLPTAEGFTITEQGEFQEAKTSFVATFNDFMKLKEGGSFGKHPLFGSLSYDDWGVLLFKHTDHHLKQFGV